MKLKLAETLEKRGMTFDELAEQIGVTIDDLRIFYDADEEPKVLNLFLLEKIIDALSCEIADILW